MPSTPGPVVLEYDEDGGNGKDGEAQLWFGPPALDVMKRTQYMPQHCIEWEYGLYRFDDHGQAASDKEAAAANEALANLKRIEALWNAANGLTDEQVFALGSIQPKDA